MQIVNQHISNHLDSFIREPNEGFEEVFSGLLNTDTDKGKLKKLLIYIEKILDTFPVYQNTEINYLHLHIDKDFNFSDRNLLLEFVILKFFKTSLKNDSSEVINDFVKKRISKLKKELERNQIPSGASGKNGGNRIFKNWKKEKNEKRDELNFSRILLYSNEIQVTTLVNILTKYYTECVNLFKSKQYGIKIDDVNQSKSYVVLNNEKTLNQIDQLDNVVDNLRNVILFDSESKSNFNNFNFKELNEWNDDGAAFKNLIIITFGNEKTNINNLKNKLNQVCFKFRSEKKDKINSYVITNNEVNQLTNQKSLKKPEISFYGIENNIFWDSFLLEVQIHENLYELISIKMRNIYSLVINENIKKIVLESIFEPNSELGFISETTQQDFPEELKSELKENLSNTLDYIINSSWKDKIKCLINETTILVVSNEFKENKTLRNELKNELELSNSNRIITWKEVNPNCKEKLLFLSYLDPGYYPYYFFPNIIEICSNNSIGYFLNLFFKTKYQWANFNNNNDYFKLLNHQIRLDYFDWNSAKKTINCLRPLVKEKTYWDLENSYVDSGNKAVIKIKLIDENRPHNYYTSDLFIYKSNDSLRVGRAIDLIALNVREIQSLDDITDALPIYDKLADINKQEEELDIIRSNFDIENGEDAGRLWKVLLRRKAEEKGKEELYFEIQDLLNRQNLKMVSFQHYENHWINPESNSLSPLVKKVFLSICKYLTLPKTYLILISRIKNKTKQATRNNTRKINLLFQDLFNDGCFDDISMTREILTIKNKYYQQNHSLEELGIDENHLLENLVALVELINPEIKLQMVDSIESITI